MVRLRRGVLSWCLRVFLFVLLFTSQLVALPPPLAAQAVRYEYDALGPPGQAQGPCPRRLRSRGLEAIQRGVPCLALLQAAGGRHGN